MPTIYDLARAHLQQAAEILRTDDNHTRQLRYIIERTVSLLDDLPTSSAPSIRHDANVLDFASFRERRLAAE